MEGDGYRLGVPNDMGTRNRTRTVLYWSGRRPTAMLSLNRKTDYALVALAYMADRPGQWSSAREIAGSAEVPLALLMNVLKTLHQGRVIRSTRGVRGGDHIAAAPGQR